MSRLTQLLNKIDSIDTVLAADLKREFATLKGRRAFGLNFERHTPETLELPICEVRRGDKVRFIPDRGEPIENIDDRIWRVDNVDSNENLQIARLIRRNDQDSNTETTYRAVENLVVIAEFRDPVYPGLTSSGRIKRGGTKPFHTVINSENFHALQLLLYTHEAKIDAIYIDPPYNSGSRDWRYNNDYVDKDDMYCHSKWLTMMERRLKLAKRLLNPNCSVLICAIDENEVHRLALLLEDLFPSSKIQMVTALINPAGANIIDQFSRVDEHLFFVHIGSASPRQTIADTTPLRLRGDQSSKSFRFWQSLQRSGGNSRREDTKAKFFQVWIDEKNQKVVGCGDHLPDGVNILDAEPAPDGLIAQWPIKQDGTEACWQVGAPRFRKYLDEGRIRLGKKKETSSGSKWGISFISEGGMKKISDGEFNVTGRERSGTLIVEPTDKPRKQVGKTMWFNSSYSARENGSRLLREIIPRRKFPYPKSLYAVEDALRFYVCDKPNAVVLDFFAGSGTTAHAVMRLNRQDGGKRTSISVTNNEVSPAEQDKLRKRGLRPGDTEWESQGICEYITKPRLKTCISGISWEGNPVKGSYKFIDEFAIADGFEENIEFFRMSYESALPVAHNKAFKTIAPLLWMKAGSQGRRIENNVADYEIADTYAVLFDLDVSRRFLTDISASPNIKMAFIVTDDDLAFQMISQDLSSRVESIRLYESYLTNFTINTGRV